ncbi:MAG: hypothetical protein QNJ97_04805 [Myxococcota bacterium]|nr:hypothetical protein [Myxococcota bacterium]
MTAPFSTLNQSVRVRNSSNQEIANNTTTVLNFNDTKFDTDHMHDIVSNNSRITFQTAGKYLVTGQAQWESNSTGRRMLDIFLNNGTIIAATDRSAIEQSRSEVVTLWEFNTGDYIELRAFQDSGSALDVIVSGENSPHFMAVRVG